MGLPEIVIAENLFVGVDVYQKSNNVCFDRYPTAIYHYSDNYWPNMIAVFKLKSRKYASKRV